MSCGGVLTVAFGISPAQLKSSDLKNHILETDVIGPNGLPLRTALEADDYFARERSDFVPDQTTVDQLKIKGATLTNGKPKTRIIAGIPAPQLFWGTVNDAFSDKNLPTNDPWHTALVQSEAASGKQIYWIDLDHFATRQPLTGLPNLYNGATIWEHPKNSLFTQDLVGSTDPAAIQRGRQSVWFWRFQRNLATPLNDLSQFDADKNPHPNLVNAFSFGNTSIYNLPTITMNGLPMRMAELGDIARTGANMSAAPIHSSWARTRTWFRPNGTPGAASQTKFGLNASDPMGTGELIPTSLVNSLSFFPDMLAQVFARNDYQPVTTFVSELDGVYIYNNNQALALGYNITLQSNPWAPLNGNMAGEEVTNMAQRQRYKLLNSPQFLTQEGTFILRTAGPTEEWNKMIFFIPHSQEAGEETAIAGENTGAPIGPRLEISCPRYQSDTAIFESPISIDGTPAGTDDFDSVEVTNVIFSNGVGSGLRIEDQSNVTVKNNVFRNFGNTNLTLINGSNWTVGGVDSQAQGANMSNVFRGGYKGMVNIMPSKWSNSNKSLDRTDFDQGKAHPLPQDLPLDFVNLTGSNLQIRYNTFEDTGTVFPEVAALQNNGYGVGNQITHNHFNRTAGAAIFWGGLNNTISDNHFTDCVLHQSDAGAVYFSRTWSQIGNKINNNYFTNIYQRTRWAGTKPALTDYVNAVMLDDWSFGFIVTANTITATTPEPWHWKKGVKLNGGAWCAFNHGGMTNYDLADRYQVAGETWSTWSDNDEKQLFRHYREFGAVLQRSGVLDTNGQFNGAWTTLFNEIGNAATLAGGSGAFTGQEMRQWYENFFAQVGVANWSNSTMPFSIVSGTTNGSMILRTNPTTNKKEYLTIKVARQ